MKDATKQANRWNEAKRGFGLAIARSPWLPFLLRYRGLRMAFPKPAETKEDRDVAYGCFPEFKRCHFKEYVDTLGYGPGEAKFGPEPA